LTSAVVCADHDVGVRCLKVLLDAGVEIRLVVTHHDNPNEAIWFQSVAALAAEHGLRCIAPSDANSDEVLAAVRAAAPDFLFSFYYRQMLGGRLLAVPRRGAFNMHGSLLPRYRGRAPVNWAVLHGERETGASLHVMDIKPDHGALVGQQAVPILADDTAHEVFGKVTLAAEIVLARALPRLIDGSAVLTPQDLRLGSYFGGRKPEDGRIPNGATAQAIHNLVRAVAPPHYPGAFFDSGGKRIVIGRTRVVAPPGTAPQADRFSLSVRDGRLSLDAADGGRLQVLAASLDGEPLDAAACTARFGDSPRVSDT